MEIQELSPKITEDHLNRKAVVYLRQSSMTQVRRNKESQRLQYALKEKAEEWGWRQIDVIDADLGASASVGAEVRKGFESLTTFVAMGEVGIIFNREASRLSRTDKDWCRLLEVCSIFHTLISDGEQIYDTNNTDDQLILGIKGTLSVYELKILRKRLIEGMEAKAARGEYRKQLPPGHVWDKSGKIVKTPNQRIQDAISLVFKKFREIQSIRQTALWFCTNNIEIPIMTERNGKKEISWQLPNPEQIRRTLRNPCYAGIYSWGINTTKIDYVDGRIIKRRTTEGDEEQARVFIKNHHEGYIDLQTYEEIKKMIRKNSLLGSSAIRVGAVRKGHAVLAGILRCGRCGRKMYAVYRGKSGTAAQYLCRGDYNSGGNYCIAFGGSTVDKEFSKEILRVISPYGMEASIEAVKMLSEKEEDRSRIVEQKIKQIEYETARAFEQYDGVDPRNRLVADELERRWNEKLEELERAKEEGRKIEEEKYVVTQDEERKIEALGERFSEVWESEYCPIILKKKIIRTVIEEVIVNLDETTEILTFIIHWKGGCHTALEMPKPPAGVGYKTSMEDLEIIRKMAPRYGDDEIARVLNKLGRKTATGKRWSEYRVRTIRGNYGISGHIRKPEDSEIFTLGGASKYLSVSRTTINRLVVAGVLKKEQVAPWAPWEIRRSELESERVKTIIDNLRKTGKLRIEGVDSKKQQYLFSEL